MLLSWHLSDATFRVLVTVLDDVGGRSGSAKKGVGMMLTGYFGFVVVVSRWW